MNIEFRKKNHKDYKQIKRLINEAWFKDYPFKKSTIKQYEQAYMYMYLADTNHSVVATFNNEVVGFLFARINKVNPFKVAYYKTRLFLLGIRMLFTKAGRRGIKIYLKTKSVNKKLIKEYKNKFDGEITLFVVREDLRGNRIGSSLEELLLETMKQKNTKNIHVFTDTYSSYGYYEKKGYSRLNEMFVDFKVDADDPGSTYYLYVKKLNNI